MSYYDSNRVRAKNPRHRQRIAFLAAKRTKMLGVVAVLALMAISLVAHYTYVLQLNYKIDRSLHELHALQDTQQHLKLEIASLRSPDRLEKIAMEEIGLQYPDQDQFIILTAEHVPASRD